MTDREKAVVMAYTGVCMLTGDKLRIFYQYIKEKLGYDVMTHELAYPKVQEAIKEAAKSDFIELCRNVEEKMKTAEFHWDETNEEWVKMWEVDDEQKQNKLSLDGIINALDAVTWYNGLAEEIIKWKDPEYLKINDEFGIKIITPNYFDACCTKYDKEQLQVIWMICVELFGDYGTSPRSGWIEDVDGFYDFVDKITELYRSSEKYEHE